ncbi:CHC2 zinc finger domain-containing protein [Chloroflexota bacterium]
MDKVSTLQMLKSYHQRGFNLIPLKPRDKIPLVKWKEYRLSNEDLLKFVDQSTNWAIRCDGGFHALDFDNPEIYESFIRENGDYFSGAPVIRTGRGYHIWFKPKTPVTSFNRDGIEVKGLGSLIVIPPSIHSSGTEYQFVRPPNGKLPEIDLDSLFETPSGNGREKDNNQVSENVPSDFALRYGKSPYPQSLCGRATKVFTRGDEEMKHLVSLRCWKWHCPKCARLMKRHWIRKLGEVSFRFIIKLPTQDKPNTLLRRLDKPGYVHIVANGESWLFLTAGEEERVWSEVEKAGYDLVAGDISGPPTPDDIALYLSKALCHENEPLNTRRKITYNRGLLKKTVEKVQEQVVSNESIQNPDTKEVEENMEDTSPNRDSREWDTEVLMKPIGQVVKELEAEGWDVLWASEVEAIAVKKKERGNSSPGRETSNILELMASLGIELRQAGSEYMGLCPFHNDRNPSLAVNAEKGVWHCFGCGKSGNYHSFLEEWETLHKG